MARTFAGGTDRLAYNGNIPTFGTASMAVRIRTTQATANVLLFSRWNTASSRDGFGLVLNNTANKLTLICYAAVTQRINITSSTSLNDGNWHDIVVTLGVASGAPNAISIDGNSEVSANASDTWTCSNDKVSVFGGAPSFWASYVGEIADYGHWHNAVLTADEIAAYGKDISANLIRPTSLVAYVPMVRETRCLRGNATTTQVGTTVSDHPRVIGSLV